MMIMKGMGIWELEDESDGTFTFSSRARNEDEDSSSVPIFSWDGDEKFM